MQVYNPLISEPKIPRWGQWRRSLLGISPEEASCAQRGFQVVQPNVQKRLDAIGQTFLEGYHAVLLDDRFPKLVDQLEQVQGELRGFAYEGAGMALALLDVLTPWQSSRLIRFLNGPGESHAYMVHVGAGWLLGRLPLSVDRCLAALDPVLGWLALDGYGFHEGYFHGHHAISQQVIPRRILNSQFDYTRQAFDQGLGRSLWFVCGTSCDAITRTIGTFAPHRRADLWSGVGLACAYARGDELIPLEPFRRAAGPYLPHLAQGVAFAAKARQRARNPAMHTEQACQLFWGMQAAAVAEVCDRTLNTLSHSVTILTNSETLPIYEQWRQKIRDQFLTEEVSV